MRKKPRMGNKKYKRYYTKQIGGIQMKRRLETHHFKQVYRPGSGNLILSGTSAEGSYNATNGQLTGPSSTASDNLYFALRFQIADIQNITSMAALFDSYRINKVVVKFIPTQPDTTGTGYGTPAGLIPPLLCTVIDRDDVTVPSSLSELEQYESYKETPATSKHTRALVPALAQQAYKSSGTTIAYTQTYKKWCDFAQTDVDHYGIHGAIYSNPTAANNWKVAYYVKVVMYFSCKQIR